MSDLGEALEAIHESARRVSSIRAAGRSGDAVWHVWWAGRRRVRSERTNSDGTLLIVQDGPRWWTLDRNGEAHTNAGDERYAVGFGEELAMLRGRALLTARLSVVRDDEVAGRPARVLRVESRNGRDDVGWRFGAAVEPFEVAIDVERGVVLRQPGMEVDAIAFDEPHADELFEAPGATAAPSPRRPPRRVTMEEARALTAYPVLLPALLPEGARLFDCAVDPDDPPRWVELSWTIEPGNRFHVRVEQGPGLAAEPPQGELSTGDGGSMWIQQHGDGAFRSSTVRIDRDGAIAEVSSDLPVAEVVRIARSLTADR